jgi:hypothetical protein
MSTGRGIAGTGIAGEGKDAEAAAASTKKRTFTGPWWRSPRVRMNLAMDRRETKTRNRQGATRSAQAGLPSQYLRVFRIHARLQEGRRGYGVAQSSVSSIRGEVARRGSKTGEWKFRKQ